MKFRHIVSTLAVLLALVIGIAACPALARADEGDGNCTHPNVTAQDITWIWKETSATASFHCNDCDSDISLAADVTSSMLGADTVVFTASINLADHTFTHSMTMPAVTATFEGDAGVASVSVYYKRSSAAPDETDVSVAAARDYTTGAPTLDGTGGVIFSIKLKTGYAVSNVTATPGTYDRIMSPKDIGKAGIWCITQLSANTVLKITTKFTLSPGWALYDGHYYYVEKDGTIRTNAWANDKNDWYYLGADGRVTLNSWVDYQGRKYFVGSDGKPLSNSWLKSGKDWYYFGSDCAAYTNQWLGYKGAYYCFDSNSKLITDSMVKYNGSLYYLGKDGKLAVSTWVSYKGAYYCAGADARIVTSNWIQYKGSYYYAGADGKICSDTWVNYKGSYYYVAKDGKLQLSTWLEYKGAWYYVGADGKPYVNAWLNYNNYWYYFNSKGHPLVSTSITLSGYTYAFDAQGRCIKKTKAA